MELQIEKRFHNLTLEQVQTLDKVLTEVFPIYGRGNFPTLEVRAKDMIRMVKERLVEREIQVKDVRLNGSTASHVMVKDNGMGYRDLDIIFGLELSRQEDFQVIKEVVLGSLRDLLPCGVNRRKITSLTMKEAYVQKMVMVFNEHDRWSLISLSKNRGKTVGLRFVSLQRRQFEFSVDSFQIILDRMLESYWETERKQGGQFEGLLHSKNLSDLDAGEEKTDPHQSTISLNLKEDKDKNSAMTSSTESPRQNEKATVPEEDIPQSLAEHVNGKHKVQRESEMKRAGLDVVSLEDEDEGVESVHSEEDTVFEVSGEKVEEKGQFKGRDFSSVLSSKTSLTEVMEPLVTNVCINSQCNEEKSSESKAFTQSSAAQTEQSGQQETVHCRETVQFKTDASIHRTDNTSTLRDSHLEYSLPPPAKKPLCSTSQDAVPDYYPSPKLPRKLSLRMSSTSVPEKLSLLTDWSDLATQLFQPTDMLKTIQPKPPVLDNAQGHHSNPQGSSVTDSECAVTHTSPTHHPVTARQAEHGSTQAIEHIAEPKPSETPPNSKAPQETMGCSCTADIVIQHTLSGQDPGPTETVPGSVRLDSGLGHGEGSVRLDSGLGHGEGSVRLNSGLGRGEGSVGLDSGLGRGEGSVRLNSGLGRGADSVGLDSGLGHGEGSVRLNSGLGRGAGSVRLDSGLGRGAGSVRLNSGLGRGAGSVGLDSGLGRGAGSVRLDSGLGRGAGSVRLDSGLGRGAGSVGLDSGLGRGAGSVRLDSGLGRGAGSVRLNSGLGRGAGSVGLNSGLGRGAGSVGLDSGLGHGEGSVRLDSGLGRGAGSVRLDSGLGHGGGNVGLDSEIGHGEGSVRLDSGLGHGEGSVRLDSEIDHGEGAGSPGENPTITVEAECMYGDFEEAMDHLRFRLIATHSPEEIRGGGLLRYSDLLVRNFRPVSATEIKSLERYMCSRFFIDFTDVSEQQRKIEAYLHCHFVGNEETSKYNYLMTLRRVIDDSTVCLMGYERRQTLSMITVLALRVLGEQNAIPNTANVTCFYQPAPYMVEPIFNSYYIAQAQPSLVYHPYPLQVHMQTGLV